MKTTHTLTQANIKNLTSLWQTAGQPFNAYTKTLDFEYCEIHNSQWPNKLWLHKSINQEIIDSIKIKLETMSSMSLPIWDIYKQNDHELLIQNGFKVKFEQVGMSLKLNTYITTKNNLKLKRVTSNLEAKLWSAIFKKAFGYTISTETLMRTLKTINYYIAYHNNTPIGTAITHKTETFMGVHSVGIPPEMRRKGYAEQLMQLLINLAIDTNNDYITLQASDMGKHLYLKLGFESQFVIRNYILE